MAKAFWKGVISFGMVVIPVKMYVATEAKTLSFHLLHKKCLTRPRQVYRCDQDKEYITIKDTVRGYEYTKGQYIVLDDADFEKVPVKTQHAIDIQQFVGAGEIDPVFYRSSHYLEPEELGVKPFMLLKEVLLKSKQVGIAKVTFQKREHLCALKPAGDIMALHTMYYDSEVLDKNEIRVPQPKLEASELEMAASLVKTMTAEFKPERFKDTYRDALKKLVEAKSKGLEIKKPAEPPAAIPDLMAALKASIEASKKRKATNREAMPVRR
jgi:DNA end-binding protein Ku